MLRTHEWPIVFLCINIVILWDPPAWSWPRNKVAKHNRCIMTEPWWWGMTHLARIKNKLCFVLYEIFIPCSVCCGWKFSLSLPLKPSFCPTSISKCKLSLKHSPEGNIDLAFRNKILICMGIFQKSIEEWDHKGGKYSWIGHSYSIFSGFLLHLIFIDFFSK